MQLCSNNYMELITVHGNIQVNEILKCIDFILQSFGPGW